MPVVQVVELPLAPSQAWLLIASPDGLCRWYAHHADIEPRVGGRYAFGWEPGQTFEGRITAWVPEKEVAFRQPSEVGLAPTDDNATLVELRVGPGEGPSSTLLGVRQSGFERLKPLYTPAESRQASDVAWRIALGMLAAALSDG